MSLPQVLMPPPSVGRIAKFLQDFDLRHGGILPSPLASGDAVAFVSWAEGLSKTHTDFKNTSRPEAVAEPIYMEHTEKPETLSNDDSNAIVRGREREPDDNRKVREIIEKTDVLKLENGLFRRESGLGNKLNRVNDVTEQILRVDPTFVTYLLSHRFVADDSHPHSSGTLTFGDHSQANFGDLTLGPGLGAMNRIATGPGSQSRGGPEDGSFRSRHNPFPGSPLTKITDLPVTAFSAGKYPKSMGQVGPESRDIMPMFSAHLPFLDQSGPLALSADPLFGQVTIVAPSIVAQSPGGSLMDISWRDIAKGLGPMNTGELELLHTALPEGSKALYPALPLGKLGANAVNLRLAPAVVQTLLSQGYGTPGADLQGITGKAQDEAGGTAHALPLPVKQIPSHSSERTAGAAAGLQIGNLSFDLADSIGGAAESRHISIARLGLSDLPSAPVLNVSGFNRFDNRILNKFSRYEVQNAPSVQRVMGKDLIHRNLLQGHSTSTPTQSSAVTSPIPRLASLTPGGAPHVGQVRPPRTSASGLRSIFVGNPSGSGLPNRIHPLTLSGGVHSPSIFKAPSHSSKPPISVGGSPPNGVRSEGRSTSTPSVSSAGNAATQIGGGAASGTPVRKPSSRFSPSRASSSPTRTIASATPASAPTQSPNMATPIFSPSHTRPLQSPAQPVLHHVAKPSALSAPYRESHVRGPAMSLPPSPAKQDSSEPVIIQASTTSSGKGGSGAAPAEIAAGQTTGAKSPAGTAGSEVALLANEVYTILKRRLTFEAERAGMRSS